MMKLQDDLDLIKMVLDGDAESFGFIINKYEKSIYRFAYNHTNNTEASKDITQEVFIAAYNRLYTYRQDSKFSNWLFRIAKNKCIDYIRKYPCTLETSIDEAESAPSKEVSPEQWAEYSEIKDMVREFIKMLKDTDRQILTLRYSETGMSFLDISQVLNMTESSVKKRFYRMRERFKELYRINERSEECD
jgi:RNA polymerase sigma-70 factor (ECF subfamily)